MRKLSLIFSLALAAGSLLFATDITLEGTVTIPQPGKDVWVTTIGGVDYAFVNAGEEGVRKIRISDRTEVASFIPTAGAVKDIWVKDTLVFVANYGDTILYILDGNLNPIGKIAEIAESADTQYRAEAITVSPDTQNVVFIAVRRIVGSEQSVFLYVVDAQDLTNPGFAIVDTFSKTFSYCNDASDFRKWHSAIKVNANLIADIFLAGHEKKFVANSTLLSNDSPGCARAWYLTDDDSVDVWHIAVLSADSSSASLAIYSYDYFHVTANQYYYYDAYHYGYHHCYPPFALKNDTIYYPLTDSLQDIYTFSSTKAYQMWVGSHAGTEYAFIARGSDGLWVLPVHPGIGLSDDIGDPIISGYKASDADDYRDVYIYGDLIFLANYGDAPGEKLFSVLNAAALEDSTLEETASYNEFFGEGIWGDSLRVYVVGDSL